MSDKLILLSAGGTGGHMMPAQALGLDLIARGYRVELITDQRGLKFKDAFEGISLHEIRAGTLGAGIKGKIKGALNLGLGVLQAQRYLHRKKPSVVVGFGGYPSFPAVYAAQKMKIPTVLHEQNAIIGKANAMLASKAERIASSTPDLRGIEESERVRTVFTGNPVRSEIGVLYNKPYPVLDVDGPLRVFVMGGSLGASVFSQVLPEALSMLPANYRERLHIVQQCREGDLERTAKMYEAANIQASLSTFIHNVAEELERAHLVIARSGASTVAEVATAGRPAIFVPYPHHADQQQRMNADVIADAGGGWVMAESGFTPEAVLARIETFLQNPEILFRTAEKARSCGRPDAALKLGNLVTALVSGWNGPE